MTSSFAPLSPETQTFESAADFASDFFEAVSAEAHFQNLSRAECAEFCVYLSCYGVPSHTLILREAETDDFMIILLTGKVDVIKSLGQTTESTLSKLGPGALVGELSLIDGKSRYASCLATTPSDFAVLTRKALNKMLIEHPKLGNKVLMMLLEASTASWRGIASKLPPGTSGRLI